MHQKPFDNPYFHSTPVQNVIFDRVMPALSPAAWKVLCVAIRQTWGWADDRSPAGQAPAPIDTQAFMERAGIAVQDVAEKAIQECLDAGYLTSHPAKDGAYTLNTGFEIGAGVEVETETDAEPALPDLSQLDIVAALSPEEEEALQVLLTFGREMAVDPDLTAMQRAVQGNPPEAVLAWVETGREMLHLKKQQRFQTVMARLRDQVPPLPIFPSEPDDSDVPPPPAPQAEVASGAELWQAALVALQSQVKRSQFRWLQPTHGLEFSQGILTVAAPNRRTQQWLEEGQLTPAIIEAVEEVVGEPIEIQFVVEE